MKISLKDLQMAMDSLQIQLSDILQQSMYREYDDLSGIVCDANNPDEQLLVDEYKGILYRLSDVEYSLSYLKRPVEYEDTLVVRPDGRYGTRNGRTYYTSGSRIEFLYNDDVLGEDGYFKTVPVWRISSVEHNGSDYFIAGYPDVDLDGLKVRVRKRR